MNRAKKEKNYQATKLLLTRKGSLYHVSYPAKKVEPAENLRKDAQHWFCVPREFR
jgi:hypothetical protein